MASPLTLRIVSIAALSLAACSRESSGGTPAEPSARPPAVARAAPSAALPVVSPAAHVAMPGPVRPEVENDAIAHHATPPPVPQSFKTSGSVGDVLESELYAFKLIAMRPCGDAPSPAAASDPQARTVIGAEVEITAKTKLMLSPKHVSLVKGGITFFGNVDLKRKVKGCTPLIPVSVMKAGDVAKGVVLFDLPVSGPGSNWKEFNLVYLPARFGGAPQVLVKLEGS